MVYKMYSLYDQDSKTYSIPQFYVNDDVAKRSILSAVLQVPVYTTFSDRFDLYCFGSFDDEEFGVDVFSGPLKPQLVITLTDMIKEFKENKENA